MLDLVNDFCLIKFRKFNVMIVLHDSAEVNQRPVVGITQPINRSLFRVCIDSIQSLREDISNPVPKQPLCFYFLTYSDWHPLAVCEVGMREKVRSGKKRDQLTPPRSLTVR